MDLWRTVPAHDGIPRYEYLTKPIQKSEQDDREYRLIRLENGLQAVLVHDENTDKGAACLHVAVGSLQDPPNMCGMAHFCEHMLSKGSGPFPAEDDFISFIMSNGGNRNAVTKPAGTYYWFSIGPAALASALPRLAAFFYSPLFGSSVTAREIKAVDSENKRNLQDDHRRAFQVSRSLSVQDHPWTKFGTGNLVSLTNAAVNAGESGHLTIDELESDNYGGSIGRETRRALIEWWKKEYCAGRMTLAVLGKESLEELETQAVKLFSPITNLGVDPRPAVPDPFWGPNEMGTVVFVQTIKDLRQLDLSFPIPYQQIRYRSKPARFISHLLKHQGPGSIHAYLKKKGWIVYLDAGPKLWNHGWQLFQISVKLTLSGLTNWPEVLLTIFSYISLLRNSPLPPFLYEELRKLSEITFRFQEKCEPHNHAINLAEGLSEPYSPELLLSAAELLWEWDEASFRETLEKFIPECGRVMLMARKNPGFPVDVGWKAEKWYGTKYHVERLNDTIVNKAKQSNVNTELYLPKPNLYIPENLTVRQKGISEPIKQPSCIRETPISTLWYKEDDQFWVPKAHLMIIIYSPIAYVTPRHAVLTTVLAELVEDALSMITYDAWLAGLSYAVTACKEGMVVSFHGYNDRLPLLMRTVLRMVKDLVVDPLRLAVVTEQMRLEYKNFYLDKPTTIAKYICSVLLKTVTWTPVEKMTELSLITEDDVRQHKEEFFARIRVESLINGNFDSQTAMGLIDVVEAVLDAQPLAPSVRFGDRSLILPEHSNFVKEEVLANPGELNSCLVYYCHFGDIADARLRPILDMIVHMIREPCFSQLRTKEQLGYIVATSLESGQGSMGLRITVQSLHDPTYLEERVDAFLEAFHQRLESLSDQELEVQKEGLIVKKLESPKNLHQETSRFWGDIRSGYYDFCRNESDTSTIRNLTLKEVLNVYATFMRPCSSTRRKLSVHLRSQKLEAQRRPVGTAIVIKDETAFKASLESSTSPVPVGSTIPRSNSHDHASKSRL